jgi:hypothetical protein
LGAVAGDSRVEGEIEDGDGLSCVQGAVQPISALAYAEIQGIVRILFFLQQFETVNNQRVAYALKQSIGFEAGVYCGIGHHGTFEASAFGVLHCGHVEEQHIDANVAGVVDVGAGVFEVAVDGTVVDEAVALD